MTQAVWSYSAMLLSFFPVEPDLLKFEVKHQISDMHFSLPIKPS